MKETIPFWYIWTVAPIPLGMTCFCAWLLLRKQESKWFIPVIMIATIATMFVLRVFIVGVVRYLKSL